jgi:general stress protein CsbA
VKQSVALHAVPLMVWVLVRARRTRPPGRGITELAIMLAGLVLVPMIFIIHAASIGTLRAMYYYCVEYNVAVHVGEASWGLTPASFEIGGNRGFIIAIAACTVAGARALALRVASCVRERSLVPLLRAFDLAQYLALHLAIALISAASLRRFFSHYFILSIPILAFVLARILDRASRRASPSAVRVVLVGTLATLLLSAALETYALEKIDGRVAHDKLPPRLAKYVEASTAKDAKIFVWGFSPWLYAYSHRRPAGRYVFSTYVTGLVPWRHDDIAGDAKRVVPGSNEALMADLDAEKPELVIDAGSIMLARPIRTYRRWADWLFANYCFELRVHGFDLYRRKPEPSFKCPEPGFPQPQRAFDFVGAPLEVPIPQTSDLDRTKWLFVPEDSLPAWYPESPHPKYAEMLVDSSELKPGMRLEAMPLPEQKR